MRNFTPEEKELIVNTPIIENCFDRSDYSPYVSFIKDVAGYGLRVTIQNVWNGLILDCEALREKYLDTNDEVYFTELVRLLPNSYKVVNLYAEKKDLCKEKQNNQNNFNKRR